MLLALQGVVQLLLIINKKSNVLGNFNDFGLFLVLCVVLGPGISALFGVTSLAAMGFLPWASYWPTLMTWWTGDGVGALLLAPLILAWHNAIKENLAPSSVLVTLLLIATSVFVAFIIFKVFPAPIWLYLLCYCIAPIVLISSLNIGQYSCFSSIVAFSSIAIMATSFGLGPFSSSSQNIALVELQLFYRSVIGGDWLFKYQCLSSTRSRKNTNQSREEFI